MPRTINQSEVTNLAGTIYADIHQERLRAHSIHGAAGNSREDADWNNNEWLPVLVEEVGEVAHWFTYDNEHDIDELRKELVQVAAMAAAWLDSIDEMMEEEIDVAADGVQVEEE